ncbi:hypothetical protein DFP72DRAFT_1043066 [Ephemerocybe angulata]|uniref:Uncharacterized protein n=1 Tax=Ephemerocybe angulata TaxID=980116 RepID=A0A8H6I8L9_9AGAR|nr:hypothetical protein DFP72DRAFT_1043066 [Tulosesus angulatus]
MSAESIQQCKALRNPRDCTADVPCAGWPMVLEEVRVRECWGRGLRDESDRGARWIEVCRGRPSGYSLSVGRMRGWTAPSSSDVDLDAVLVQPLDDVVHEHCHFEAGGPGFAVGERDLNETTLKVIIGKDLVHKRGRPGAVGAKSGEDVVQLDGLHPSNEDIGPHEADSVDVVPLPAVLRRAEGRTKSLWVSGWPTVEVRSNDWPASVYSFARVRSRARSSAMKTRNRIGARLIEACRGETEWVQPQVLGQPLDGVIHEDHHCEAQARLMGPDLQSDNEMPLNMVRRKGSIDEGVLGTWAKRRDLWSGINAVRFVEPYILVARTQMQRKESIPIYIQELEWQSICLQRYTGRQELLGRKVEIRKKVRACRGLLSGIRRRIGEIFEWVLPGQGPNTIIDHRFGFDRRFGESPFPGSVRSENWYTCSECTPNNDSAICLRKNDQELEKLRFVGGSVV